MKSRKQEIPIVTQSGRFTDAYNSFMKKKKMFSYQGRNLKLFLCVCKRFQFSLLQKCLKHPAWQQQGCQKKESLRLKSN